LLIQKLLSLIPDPQQKEQAQEFLIDASKRVLRDEIKGHHNERRR
jgi:hypothetical protein